jgi:phenylalanyl-tRNA synthetase beta chain
LCAAPSQSERITTLDGQQHTLEPSMLMICDAEQPVAVAGIMGGAETEVTDDTRHILMESAHFSPTSIRATARKLGLRTESSYRFERFVDPNLVIVAQHRVCELLEGWTGVAAVPGVIDVYPRPFEARLLTVRLARASRLLGFEVRADEAHAVLERLNLRPEPIEGGFRVQVPPYRADLQREEDLIEELGRILGYERIPAVPPAGYTTQGKDSPEGAFAERVRTILLSAGLQEIVGHTLEAPSPLQSGGEGVGEMMYQPMPLQKPDERRPQLPAPLADVQPHPRRRPQPPPQPPRPAPVRNRARVRPRRAGQLPRVDALGDPDDGAAARAALGKQAPAC